MEHFFFSLVEKGSVRCNYIALGISFPFLNDELILSTVSRFRNEPMCPKQLATQFELIIMIKTSFLLMNPP